MKFIELLFLVVIGAPCFAQQGWTWTALPPMPEPVANNAVVEAMSNDTLCIYSFCGIDETKQPAGIHLKAWKYNTVSQIWSAMPDVPDENGGKIAAGASVVDNIIYLIGGYHVASNMSEVSSEKVHRFDPNTDTWLSDGSPIPVPIDDHVQAVWNNSWIYVITGWSDSGNVNDVQIYNPNVDQWSVGTPTPNGVNYEAFGTSGTIIGDTIYYFGGVQGSFSFTANAKLRKGVIDTMDPAIIEWSQLEDSPGGPGYRTAAAHYEDQLFWIGGAGVAYNFNGQAYNGTGGVEPTGRIATYYAGIDQWLDDTLTGEEVMDLRGIGKVSPTAWILCGGMETDQMVSNRTFLLEYDPSVSVTELGEGVSIKIENGFLEVKSMAPIQSIEMHQINGKISVIEQFQSGITSVQIPLPSNIHGLIIVTVVHGDDQISHLKLIQHE
jgi:hypothetical protein